MSASLRDQIARSLIELNGRSVAIVDEADELLDAITEATKRRNDIVHNSFARHPETGEVFSIKFKSRGSLQVSQKPVAIGQIRQDAAFIYEVGMDLARFMAGFGLVPVDRSRPVRAGLDRGKKAREVRRSG